MWKKQLLLALMLAATTFVLVGWAEKHLPYSETKIRVVDALTIPGGFLAAIFYPQGIHTGSGSSQFVYFVFAGNLFFYLAIWYGLIWVGSRAVRSGRKAPEHGRK